MATLRLSREHLDAAILCIGLKETRRPIQTHSSIRITSMPAVLRGNTSGTKHLRHLIPPHLQRHLLAVILVIAWASSSASAHQCGYAGCYLGEKDALNIHLVPHTHDDVGWLKTVDEYYFGLKNEFHRVKVESIIDTVIEALLQNENRRFIYVEMAYFHKWWVLHRNATLRGQVHRLVQEGRLQFVLGGWSMNDEVTTHYNDIIDQHTRGMRFLTNHFGECGQPLVAWQIDPFGHSREQASLFAQMGFDAVYAWRIDSQEKDYRTKNKMLEMIWHSSDDASDGHPLFMGIMEDGYFTPSRTCFDMIMCSGLYTSAPDIPNFIRYSLQKAAKFATNHILIPIGGDFQFQTSKDAFRLIDAFIDQLNSAPESDREGKKIKAFYSTPSCYTRAVFETNTTFPTKSDDFLPLMEDKVTVWTGFYTTRPNLKRHVRVMSNLLQCTEKMAVLSGFIIENELDREIDSLRQALGVLQHHDAVTGTSKVHVASNYGVLLSQGREACYKTLFYSLINSNFYKSEQQDIQWHQCPHLNMSACHISERKKDFILVLYNGGSQPMKSYFRIPLASDNHAKYLQVYDYENLDSPLSIVIHPIPTKTDAIPERLQSKADVEAVFPVEVPALGYSSYVFTFSTPKDVKHLNPTQPLLSFRDSKEIQNNFYRFHVNNHNGLIDGEFWLMDGQFSLNLRQEVCYYESHSGSNGAEDRSSGAYVFHPESSTPVCTKNTKSTKISRSPYVQEIHQEFNETWLFQVIRIYQDSPFLEVEWTVGPLPSGKEVILRYSTNWPSDGQYFTDANCRQTIVRHRDKRAFPGFNQTAPVSGNYYPVNCFIGIPSCGKCKEPTHRLAVINDRSQGGASIQDGQVELMVHRTTSSDDGLGVGEPLNDRGADGEGLISRGKHWLLIARHDEFDSLLRSKTQAVFNDLIPLFITSPHIHQRDQFKYKFPTFAGILKPLPSNVRVLTLDRWKNGTFLLRLEHFHQRSSHPTHLGEAVYLNYQELFSNLHITHLEELTLAGNRPVSYLRQRLPWWQLHNNEASRMKVPDESSTWMNATHISLQPMQIRTFQIRVRYAR